MRLNFYCDTYPGTTNYYEGILDDQHWMDPDMMYFVKIPKSEFVTHGTPNWNAVKWIGFITSPSGQAGPVDIYGGSCNYKISTLRITFSPLLSELRTRTAF